MSQSAVPECIWPVAAELGEGPLWRNGAVWFIDIKQDRIHCFDPVRGSRQKLEYAGRARISRARSKSGKFIAGTKTGLHIFAPDTGRFDEHYGRRA